MYWELCVIFAHFFLNVVFIKNTVCIISRKMVAVLVSYVGDRRIGSDAWLLFDLFGSEDEKSLTTHCENIKTLLALSKSHHWDGGLKLQRTIYVKDCCWCHPRCSRHHQLPTRHRHEDVWSSYNIRPDHLLLDSAPNLGPLISRWELGKFKNCWNKSFRTSEILTLLYQQFSNLLISQTDMSGPRLGALSNNR
jgi:hypothetical protein